MKIRKDDNVLVIAGKDKGKKGKVRYAYPKDGTVLVEGVNFIKKNTRATGQTKQAGIIEREEPVNVSDVMLIAVNVTRRHGLEISIWMQGKKSGFVEPVMR